MSSRHHLSRRPRLVLMTTGGTIGTARSYATRLSAEELLALVPGFESVAEVELDAADSRPSPSIGPVEMLGLAQRAERHLERPEVDGIVVTYGTDAMDEFIYLLHLAVASPKPIAVTGAMLHSRDPSADGPRNLLHSLMVAGCPETRERGAILVFNGQIHSACDVVKVNSTNLAAFASPKYGPLGAIEGNRVTFRRAGPPRSCIITQAIEPNVDLITASIGMDARFIDASVAAGARGLVIAGMGGGAVPKVMSERLHELACARFPVVRASRCIQGSVLDGGMLEDHYLAAGDLAPHKARIKLMLVLGATRRWAPEEAWQRLRSSFPG